MGKFMTENEYKVWIDSQDWYQSIYLKNNMVTPGKFDTHKRIRYLDRVDFSGKRVLDIGCNSGQYCLYAKNKGAAEVIGIDIDNRRLEQARILAENEGANVTYLNRSLFDLKDLGQFDVVLCIAVLTEVTDLVSAVGILKEMIGGYAFLEMDIVSPLLYLPFPKSSWRNYIKRIFKSVVVEMRQTKKGDWVMSPTLELLGKMFGDKFTVRCRGKGVRYDMIDVYRRNA